MKTILVVDDNPETLLCYDEMLSMSGYRVVTFEDVRSALLYLHAGNRVDLIITDYRMSGMNGLEFIAELKDRALQIPVLMCSAHLRGDVYAKAMDLGAADYLQKPVSKHDLDRIIAKTLGGDAQQPSSNPPVGR